MDHKAAASWEKLLEDAVNIPGRILEAYSAFHGYSLGNQMLALFQCYARGIPAGPISTYNGWKDKGRQVRKGEKALVLCMPVTCKRDARATKEASSGDDTGAGAFTRFIYRPNWFVLSQTDGATQTELWATPAQPAQFDFERALATLGITRVEFDHGDGNAQGYARGRTIAISPLAQLPHKTTFHELAHVMLGHTAEAAMHDGDNTPRSLCEVEAEAVALLCCESLGMAGGDYARGYIQHWLKSAGTHGIPEKNAQRIFKAADSILRAGQLTPAVA